MRILKPTLISIEICVALGLAAQEPSPLAAAKAMDQEILKLKDLPYDVQAIAAKALALRIRQQPGQYAIALAFNLAITATDADDRDMLQEVASTLADALRRSPAENKNDDEYRVLAELARYDHMQVSLDDPRYAAAISRLEADDQHRSESDFTLIDLQGQKWNLKSLRGKVVLLNFWATWCPPCRMEIPDLETLSKRFRTQGLVVLSISDEKASVLRRFLSQQKVSYPVLLDSGHKVKDLFRLHGVPQSFVYNREGRLVAESISGLTIHGFLEILGQAGLQ